jgi:hypothetical protein
MVKTKSEFTKYLGKHVRIIVHRGLKGQRSRTIEGYVIIVRGLHLYVADYSSDIRHRGHGVWIRMYPRHMKDIIEVIEGGDTT